MSRPNTMYGTAERDDELAFAPAMPPAVALEVETVFKKLAALGEAAVAWEQAPKTDPAALAQTTAELAEAAEDARAAVVHLSRTLDGAASRAMKGT